MHRIQIILGQFISLDKVSQGVIKEIYCELTDVVIFRLLPAIEVFEQKELLWTSIINNLSKLLDTEFEEQDVRTTMELLLVMHDEDKQKIETVIHLLNKHI